MRISLFQQSLITTRLKGLSFELQIWLVMAVLASLRTFKAVVQDLINATDRVSLIVDLSILFILSGVLYLIVSNKIRYVPTLVGIALSVLVMFSYIQFGGIIGTTEYNVLGLAAILSLGYKGRNLILVLTIYSLLVVYASLDLYLAGPVTTTLFKKYSASVDNFFSTLVTLVVLMLYFKTLLIHESRRIREAREKRSQQNKMIRSKNEELEAQRPFIEEAIKKLDVEIGHHTNRAVAQDKALQEYIVLSTKLIHTPFERIKRQRAMLQGQGYLFQLLDSQINELDRVISSLNSELINNSSGDIG